MNNMRNKILMTLALLLTDGRVGRRRASAAHYD